MNKIISLTKTLYKSNKNFSNKLKNKTKIGLYAVLLIYLLFIFMNFWKSFIIPLDAIDMSKTAIDLIIATGTILMFTLNIAYVPNLLYFSKDTDTLFTLPLKTKEIFTSKLLLIYIYNLLIISMFVVPGFLEYGLITNAGVSFFVKGILVSLLIPVIPILILTVFATLITQFFKFAKHKNAFKIITTIFFLALVVIFEFNMNTNMETNGEISGEALLVLSEGINKISPRYLEICGNIFADNNFTSNTSLAFFTFINIFLVFLVINIFSEFYMKGVYYNFDLTVKGKKQKSKNRFERSSQYLSLVQKEIKSLFRNSTYFIQCVLPTIFVPVIIIFTSSASLTDESLTEMLGEGITIKFVISMIFVYAMLISNQISTTAISRAGIREHEYMQTLPIKNNKIINAKVMPGIIIGIAVTLVGTFYVAKLFSLSFIEAFAVAIIIILLNIVNNYLQIMLDKKHPKLEWESELAVVKQNMNIINGFLISIGMLILIACFGNIIGNI